MIKRAFDISVRNLRACYSKNGILAGKKHFDDYWARDGFFSSIGSLYLGDYSVVKKNLELFIKHMKEDGQIPLRINDYYLFFKFLNIPFDKIKITNKKIRYGDDKFNHITTDQNSLFIIALREYVKYSEDNSFFKKNADKILISPRDKAI